MPHKWDEEEETSVTKKEQVVKYVLRNRQPGESIEGSFGVNGSYRALDYKLRDELRN